MDVIEQLIKEHEDKERAKRIEAKCTSTVPLKYCIFIASDGRSYINDKKHVDNFTKYLFSCSSSHKENAQTRNNFFQVQSGLINGNNNAKENYNTTKNKLWNLTTNPAQLRNDLFTIAYYFDFGDEIVTNIFYRENDQIKILPLNNHFYEKNNTTLKALYAQFTGESSSKKLTEFTSANTKAKQYIAERIFEEMPKVKNNEELLVQVIHLDQEERPPHVHRLIKTK